MTFSLSDGSGSFPAFPIRAEYNTGAALSTVNFFASTSMSGKVHIYRRGE